MRQVSQFSWIFFIFLFGIVWMLSGCTSDSDSPPETTPILVWEYKNQTAFDTVYPEGWEYGIIREGFIVFAPPNVAYDSESGPSMSILREAPGVLISSLQEELDHFLEYGPLREDYFLISEVNPVTIGQYDGLEVAVERESTEMFIAMKAMIYVIRTDSGSLYTFMATAPTEQWEESWPLLSAIIQNGTFNE
ncbi:MAG: hypothetical protein A2Z14_01790 [Chloroflexi bacterium RBG_16_48_8]|nr:MAG: hypothetical protein A2Z14_01790 [Chloroflexi bacterium RBG_16_48_8]